MSVIAPNFKLSGFIKSIIDDAVWFLLIFSLIGFPVIMMVLFYIPMPVIDGELLTPFLAFTYLADPTRTLPIVQAFMTTDMFKVMALDMSIKCLNAVQSRAETVAFLSAGILDAIQIGYREWLS